MPKIVKRNLNDTNSNFITYRVAITIKTRFSNLEWLLDGASNLDPTSVFDLVLNEFPKKDVDLDMKCLKKSVHCFRLKIFYSLIRPVRARWK